LADLRIGLIDSNEAVRVGRAMVLNSQPDMRVVLEESDPVIAIERASNYLVDVLVVGPSQHRLRGSQFIEALCRSLVESKNDSVVLAYGAFNSSKARYEAINSGAQEFVGLDEPSSRLLDLVRKIVKQDFHLPLDVLKEFAHQQSFEQLPSQLEALKAEYSESQLKVIDLFLSGLNDQAIAKELDLARTRVTSQLEIAMRACGFSSRNQLILALLRAQK
jgi:DNA-binding NarL/FixJ family response regulator